MSILTLDQALADSRTVLLDTSAIIAFQVTSDPVHPLARHVFQRLANPDDPLVGYYAAVSAFEMLVRP